MKVRPIQSALSAIGLTRLVLLHDYLVEPLVQSEHHRTFLCEV